MSTIIGPNSSGSASSGLTDAQLRATPVPVSGTVTVTDASGPLTVDGTVTVTDGSGSLTVDGTVGVSGNVTVIQGTGTNLHAVIDSGSTTAVTQATGTNLHTVVDSGSITAVQGTGTNLHAVVDSGSITATQATGTNLHAVIDSGSTTAVTQATGTNLHAVIDSGSTTAVTQATGTNLHTVVDSGAVAATQSGTWTVQPGNTANSTAWLVKLDQTTTNNDVDVASIVPPTLTKAAQGSTGFSVQSLVDAGRTHINLWANAAAAGTTGTETAITLTKSSGTSATSSAVSFVITGGKRFRITSFSVASRGHLTATAQTTTFNLRINTGGAVITSSTPIVLSAGTATPATAQAWDRFNVPIPDGFEILGDGTLQFGLTAAATYTTNAPTWYAVITGFEY